MAKKTLLEKWREESLAPELKKLMDKPAFRRAMEIIQEHTEPNDLVCQKIYRECPQYADQVLAAIHKMQAGERRVIRMFKALSEMQQLETAELPEPFSHVDESYFETRQN